MATSAAGKKIEKLYGSLSEKELTRMHARLFRMNDIAELEKLRRATPQEHGASYNRTRRLLRVLNGNVPDWLLISGMGMERERFRLDVVIAEGARLWLEDYRMHEVWKLTPYPVTESEYRAIVKVQRTSPSPVDEWVERAWEMSPETPGLRPELAIILRERPPYDDESDEAEEHEEKLWQRFYGCFLDAIERGELKTKPRPKDANGEDDGEPWVATGALSDWTLNTTEETFEPLGPAFAVPIIDELFAGSMHADWDIRPNSEGEYVKERRETLRDVFLELAGFPRNHETAPTLEPPLTLQALRKAQKEASELFYSHRHRDNVPAQTAVAAAKGFAAFRAQLEGLAEAIEIVQRDDFYGEDPLLPEFRELLEKGQVESEAFAEAWAENTMMTYSIRQELGLPVDTSEEVREPPPLPTEEPKTQAMLELIRAWEME